MTLHGTVVCVESRPSGPSKGAPGYVLQYLLIVLGVTVALLVLVQYRKCRARAVATDDPEQLRATCSSSILYEDGPTQFVSMVDDETKSHAHDAV
ncbi:hypothetical protein ACHHYP_00820 [Achlya hypogyna]|uniref:Uncharacterized protein n=1 Tax=Achlya hypogyna TaxID=1202772 RepID=A0A1V9ZAC0_ACHHY|nr:hypothetical protein ACHHYP_00820 [Achlya hypogyna]